MTKDFRFGDVLEYGDDTDWLVVFIARIGQGVSVMCTVQPTAEYGSEFYKDVFEWQMGDESWRVVDAP